MKRMHRYPINFKIIIISVLLFTLSCNPQKVYTEQDISGTYDVYISKYAGLIKSKQHYQFHIFPDNIAVFETCNGNKKGYWYIEDNHIICYGSDSLYQLGIVNTINISNINTLKENNSKFIRSHDSAIRYIDFIYTKTKHTIPLKVLLKDSIF